jgi:hypothetical protein
MQAMTPGKNHRRTIFGAVELAIIRRSKIVQRWLAAHPRILVLHGARYSPQDNPVERVWGPVKAA